MEGNDVKLIWKLISTSDWSDSAVKCLNLQKDIEN